MFGIKFLKASPTTHVLHYKRGVLKREGAGLAFFYYAPTSQIVCVPLATADLPFAFQESTSDFQTVTVQGQITYRVKDPKRISTLLDFAIRADGKHQSKD